MMRKTISNPLSILEGISCIEKIEFLKYHFEFIQTYASLFAKEMFPKLFILNKVCITKTMFQNKFQILFYSFYFIRVN
jgi:hypothetical protein